MKSAIPFIIMLVLASSLGQISGISYADSGTIPITPRPAMVETDHNVVAGYMPFWGMRPYQNWGDIDKHASFYPLLGSYKSDDPYIYDWHIYWAKSAGIDTFMFDMGWFDTESSIAGAIESVLNNSEYADEMRFTFNYFTSLAWWKKQENPSLNVTEYIMDDFESLADKFFWRDNFLRINGVPILYMVSDWEYSAPTLAGAVEGIREVFRTHLDTEVIILIDYVWPGGSNQLTDIGVFDGVYKLGELGFVWEHYDWGNMSTSYTEMFYYNNLTCYEYTSTDLPGDIVFTPCIMPGFNNTYLHESGQSSHLLIVEGNATLYEIGIRQLINYMDPSLNMLYLHTWNDLQEGSSIEPTVEYGLQYLEALYSGLVDSDDVQEFFTPKSYAEEVIFLAESAIEENRTVVDDSVLQEALHALSQAETNFSAGNYRDATTEAIRAYELMGEPPTATYIPMEVILAITIIGVVSVCLIAVKLGTR